MSGTPRFSSITASPLLTADGDKLSKRAASDSPFPSLIFTSISICLIVNGMVIVLFNRQACGV